MGNTPESELLFGTGEAGEAARRRAPPRPPPPGMATPGPVECAFDDGDEDSVSDGLEEEVGVSECALEIPLGRE